MLMANCKINYNFSASCTGDHRIPWELLTVSRARVSRKASEQKCQAIWGHPGETDLRRHKCGRGHFKT